MFYTLLSITATIQKLRLEGRSIVLATGFFDLLHAEHINFLVKAKAQGDILIVAVESDARARASKGEGRPIESQSTRCQKVAVYADYVIALGDDFNTPAAYEDLMRMVRPQVYAVSSHTSYLDLKKALTEKYGGELVIVHEFNPEISTSKIIRQNQV